MKLLQTESVVAQTFLIQSIIDKIIQKRINVISQHTYNHYNLNSNITTYNVNSISVITLPYFLDLRASGAVLRFYWSISLQMTAFTNKIRQRHNTYLKVTSQMISSLASMFRVNTWLFKGSYWFLKIKINVINSYAILRLWHLLRVVWLG